MNLDALWAWVKNENRKPPDLAFTAGPEREVADLVAFAVNRERERCAKVAEEFGSREGSGLRWHSLGEEIADKIREGRPS